MSNAVGMLNAANTHALGGRTDLVVTMRHRHISPNEGGRQAREARQNAFPGAVRSPNLRDGRVGLKTHLNTEVTGATEATTVPQDTLLSPVTPR